MAELGLFLDGPAMKKAVERGTDADMVGKYRYVDRHGRRVAAWSALHVEVWAAYIEMGRNMDALERAIRALPGCVGTEQIREDSSMKRPRVVGIFGVSGRRADG